MTLQKGEITKFKQLTEDVVEITVTPKKQFDFKAGQFITIKIEDNNKPCFRAYSIASSPNKDRSFDLCIKKIKGGRGSTWLCNQKEGNQLTFMGPNGKFIFSSSPESEILYIATGTGIAPLKSMIETQLEIKNKQKMHLLFGLRYIKDLFYQNVLQKLSEKHSNFTYDITLSQPENKDYQGNKGRVTDILKNLTIKTKNTEVYICGLNAMIESTTKILKDKGLQATQIHFEKYD